MNFLFHLQLHNNSHFRIIEYLGWFIAAFALGWVVFSLFCCEGSYINPTINAKIFCFTHALTLLSAISWLSICFKRTPLQLTIIDLLYTLGCVYSIFHYYIAPIQDIERLYTTLQLLILYIDLRVLLSFYKGLSALLIVLLLYTGIHEAVLGIRQILGFSASQHALFGITGSMFNPGPYGGYIVAMFALSLGVITTTSNLSWPRSKQWINNLQSLHTAHILYMVAWLTVLLTCSIIPASMSRSAWIAAFGVVLWAGIARYGSKWLHQTSIWIVGATILIGCLWGIYVLKKDSADGRLLIWKTEIKAISHKPWLGYGAGAFRFAQGEAQREYFQKNPSKNREIQVAGAPEYGFNDYLQIAIERGCIGLILFLSIGIVSGKYLYQRRSPYLYILIALSIFSFSSYPLNLLSFKILWIIIIATAAIDSPSLQLCRYRGIAILLTGVLGGVSFYICRHETQRKSVLKEWQLTQYLYNTYAYKEAVKGYAALFDPLKHEHNFLFQYGHALNKTGDYDLSSRILRLGAQRSNDPMFYNILGNNAKSSGHFSQAEHYYRLAFEMLPNRMYPLYLLMQLYLAEGKQTQACQIADSLINMTPKIPSNATQEFQQEARQVLDSLSTYTPKTYCLEADL